MIEIVTATPAYAVRADAIRLPLVSDAVIRICACALIVAIAVVLIALPLYALLSQSLEDASGAFVGIGNFLMYAQSPALRQSVMNSIFVSAIASAITIPLAFIYSYALTRSCLRAKSLFKGIALLPILAPSLLPAIALTYMFGNQGFMNSWLLGHKIYGPIGIVIAQVFHCFPHAVLILTTALSISDARLYEVAAALGTSRWRVFWTITFPAARYGLIGACFVVFTTAIVDFGIAKVIGGQFSVLAIDVYKQIIGQQNFQMGAVIGVLLLLPAAFSFAVERITHRHQTSQLSARALLLRPKPRPLFDATMLLVTSLVACFILGIVGVAMFASFVTLWPYDLSLSLASYDFANFDPAGWSSYWNSVIMASFTALLGTVLAFTGAYLVEKGHNAPALRSLLHILAVIPLAVPGIVLGLGYVFFFNAPRNPLNFLYGSMAILVMCSIAHYYTVPHLTAMTALKQIDKEFEAVSDALGVPFWVTFARVTVPISLPAILDIATYFFVNAMTTVAGIIFIYSPENKVASVAVVAMDDTGDVSAACAMALMIVYTSAGVKLLQVGLSRLLLTNVQRWRTPGAG
jgi:iron(III) transport system permease protein